MILDDVVFDFNGSGSQIDIGLEQVSAAMAQKRVSPRAVRIFEMDCHSVGII